MCKIICLLLTLLSLAGQAAAVTPTEESLTFQIVRTAGEEVLWESPVKPGDYFTIDYRHSSDNTPVHDLFQIGSDGLIVLIEESYRWYGAGLESHPDVGKTDFTGEWTRVRLHRPFPRFLLRVGKVANHVLTLHGRDVPLLSIARGGDSIWIRATKSVNRK
ncbi:MAG: DUF1850 domain-containing protein [Proteobacteria bacterium]|nr:DUF1850 domain-containing protein [Pseudomonadota bacterium]MBU4581964.1 DUF1850 domain-containing protein [Pseudomonadota bacterium]MCG2740349.1 DUF1850 domain-containing protein [Syntrophaceae bacterium]